MFPVQIPDEYPYVLVAASSSLFVNVLHYVLTALRRKASGIKYPTPYATTEQTIKDPKAMAFNCAQRAHANFIEHQPSFLASLAIAGLQFPLTTAALGLAWTSGRVIYALGYASGNPDGRLPGAYIGLTISLILKLMAMYASVSLIKG